MTPDTGLAESSRDRRDGHQPAALHLLVYRPERPQDRRRPASPRRDLHWVGRDWVDDLYQIRRKWVSRAGGRLPVKLRMAVAWPPSALRGAGLIPDASCL